MSKLVLLCALLCSAVGYSQDENIEGCEYYAEPKLTAGLARLHRSSEGLTLNPGFGVALNAMVSKYCMEDHDYNSRWSVSLALLITNRTKVDGYQNATYVAEVAPAILFGIYGDSLQVGLGYDLGETHQYRKGFLTIGMGFPEF